MWETNIKNHSNPGKVYKAKYTVTLTDSEKPIKVTGWLGKYKVEGNHYIDIPKGAVLDR